MTEAWHEIHINSLGEGRCHVYESTNDDNDDGYPDGHVESWDYEDKLERALKRHGTSRIGISGVRVTVTLDGEELR